MQVKQLAGNGKIVIARTEVYVPHLGEVLAFALPMTGEGTYNGVMGAIDSEKLARPTTAQTFSLVDLALKNRNDEHCRDLLSKFRNRYFWSATENLWGKEDVIVYDNVDGKMPTDRASLIKRMQDGDKAVRVVKYDEFSAGSQSVTDLVKNPYVLAQVGNNRDFAEDVIARVAKGVSQIQPHVWALGPQNSDVKKYTALGSNCYYGGLNIFGNFVGDFSGGYASGVRIASADEGSASVAKIK
jgi:hypothetical protein